VKVDAKSTVILIENGLVFTHSTAALKITSHLKLPYSALRYLTIIPRFFRDALYKVIAVNRYHWFGVQSECLVPSEEIKVLFLHDVHSV